MRRKYTKEEIAMARSDICNFATGAGLVFLLLGFLVSIMPSEAEERLPVIVDNYSGFAIDGYDPVGYFTDQRAEPGIDGIEARYGGLSWRFENEGNRKAFLISPHIYIPQFGGNDPMALSRGTVTRGDPQVFLLYKDQLYFFFSAYTLEDFLSAPPRTLRAAGQNWAKLKDQQ